LSLLPPPPLPGAPLPPLPPKNGLGLCPSSLVDAASSPTGNKDPLRLALWLKLKLGIRSVHRFNIRQTCLSS